MTSAAAIAPAYAAAGVDIGAGERFVKSIAPLAAQTHANLRGGARVLRGIGGFAAALTLPTGMRRPVLLAAADGAGTKLQLARAHGAVQCIGQDVVAMCVNDLLCAGAMPLLFLDYIASERLDEAFATAALAGMARACKQCGCALAGGETAELPGVYAPNGCDIAGFAAGVTEEDDLIAPSAERGDALIALGSDGAHSNGYSLIRKLLAERPALADARVDTPAGAQKLHEWLLRPTRLYDRAVQSLRAGGVRLRGLAHITGGGLAGNVPRALPAGARAALDEAALPLPPPFELLAQAGDIALPDMRRIFNCGVGMVAITAARDAERAIALLRDAGERAWRIGAVA